MNIPARNQFNLKHTSGQSHQFIYSRRKKNIWTLILALISIITWLYAFSSLSHLEIFNIKTINISGADKDISNTLKATALNSIQGEYFGLFSRSNLLAYPKEAIMTAIMNTDARVNDVTVERSGIQSLNITVREKIPAAVVCTNLPDWDESDLILDSFESCYLVDDTGYVFMNASSSNAEINRYYLPNIAIVSTSTSIIGTKIASTTMFRTLQSFYNGAKSYNIDIKALLVKDGGEYELYAATESGVIVVYFNEINGFENEFTALISFWNDLTQKARNEGNKLKLDSIDLRYGSNVFYRIVK